jgi:hemerythrin-like domain-containing protein
MTDTIAVWRAEHLNFAKLLDILEEQLQRFHTGDEPNYELMLDIMFYMTHYSDLLHHPREDLAFE